METAHELILAWRKVSSRDQLELIVSKMCNTPSLDWRKLLDDLHEVQEAQIGPVEMDLKLEVVAERESELWASVAEAIARNRER